MKLLQGLILLITIFYFSNSYAHGTIKVYGVEHEEGYIDIKIYSDDESFLNEKQAIESIRKKPTKGLTTIPLSIIHEGEMAIVVYHDENNDNKLNTGLFWRPKEGYAFSNQYVPKGPPKFTKAKINVSHNQPIEIQLNY